STGMSTLLHAPIQALVQQTEWHDAEGPGRQDTTLLFSEENEMDMTASHTAIISRNLRNLGADKTGKIDITSFLAELNSSHATAGTSEEFPLLPDPTNHPSLEQKEEAPAVKKINFSEFLLSLKSNENTPSPAEGPEKENVFFVPSQGSEDVAQSCGEFVYSHEAPDTCSVTRVFRGQEGGMEMTKCEAAEVKIPFSGARAVSAIRGSVSSETVFRGDQTVVFPKSEDMEMTGNYTDIVYTDSAADADSFQNSGRQDKTHPVRAVNKVLPTRVDSERHFPMGKTVPSGEDLKAPPSADGLWAGASQPGKGSSQLPLFGGKSVLFPSGESMDLTGNCVVMVPDYTINVVLAQTEAAPGHPVRFALAEDMEITRTHTAQDRLPVPAVPADKTVVFALHQEDMEITASHTVAVNDNVHGFEAHT
ncbi:KNL1 protein, partial [Sapayoa aenigma]|nr:KNL1 protein [Sapayoa aenigma]